MNNNLDFLRLKIRAKPRDLEHQLQCECFKWFSFAYPQLRGLLFACPNGGRRDAVTGAKLKAEGVVPGVADLLLLVPSSVYHGLCIEMKTPAGRQSPAQKSWQKLAESHGYKYVLCRDVDGFIRTIKNYLSYDY